MLPESWTADSAASWLLRVLLLPANAAAAAVAFASIKYSSRVWG